MRETEQGGLDAAHLALSRGDWPAAQDAFGRALAEQESPEAHLGMSEAVWWLGDMSGCVTHLEHAYAGFRRGADDRAAADVALWLAYHNRKHLANAIAAHGWLARAERLVRDGGIDDLVGELCLMRACIGDDPAAAEARAREALDHGRRKGDPDLELWALSQLGALLVDQARVSEGVALLGEALASALAGEARRRDTIVFTSCNMIVSCSRSADFERATEWVRASDRFSERYGCPFLHAECRAVYGEVLIATGAWRRAEEELTEALDATRGTVPTVHEQALASLARLRLVQGRLEEAERLVSGLEGRESTALVEVQLHLRRGNASLALASARRRLDREGIDEFERAELSELLGEAELALGDTDAALAVAGSLADLGRSRPSAVIAARGDRLLGRALLATDRSEAPRQLDAALAAFLRLGMPYEAARTRLLLARALHEREPELAVTEARVALAAFEDLGAGGDADAAAAWLREVGVRAARAGPRGLETLTKREREVLGLLRDGLSNPEIADRLHIRRKTVEHHVSQVLSKLGLRSRAEAAAEAVRRLEH